jgi:hypothetical protein
MMAMRKKASPGARNHEVWFGSGIKIPVFSAVRIVRFSNWFLDNGE